MLFQYALIRGVQTYGFSNGSVFSFAFQSPSCKLSDKDRAAITAKQLSDFLHLYNRETELYADTVDRPRTVPNQLFQKFLVSARLVIDCEVFIDLKGKEVGVWITQEKLYFSVKRISMLFWYFKLVCTIALTRFWGKAASLAICAGIICWIRCRK